MDINELLDECKKRLGVESDYELHKLTGMNEAAISKCRRQIGNPNNQMLFIIAEVLGIEERKLIAQFEVQFAKSDKTKEFWQKKLRALGGMAASVAVLIVTLIVTTGVPTPSQAAPVLDTHNAFAINIHYAKYQRLLQHIKRKLLLLLKMSKIRLRSLVPKICQPSA